MQKFKQLNSSTIILAGKIFKGYTVGDLPKTFGLYTMKTKTKLD